jgi:hypothetical protein
MHKAGRESLYCTTLMTHTLIEREFSQSLTFLPKCSVVPKTAWAKCILLATQWQLRLCDYYILLGVTRVLLPAKGQHKEKAQGGEGFGAFFSEKVYD